MTTNTRFPTPENPVVPDGWRFTCHPRCGKCCNGDPGTCGFTRRRGGRALARRRKERSRRGSVGAVHPGRPAARRTLREGKANGRLHPSYDPRKGCTVYRSPGHSADVGRLGGRHVEDPRSRGMRTTGPAPGAGQPGGPDPGRGDHPAGVKGGEAVTTESAASVLGGVSAADARRWAARGPLGGRLRAGAAGSAEGTAQTLFLSQFRGPKLLLEKAAPALRRPVTATVCPFQVGQPVHRPRTRPGRLGCRIYLCDRPTRRPGTGSPRGTPCGPEVGCGRANGNPGWQLRPRLQRRPETRGAAGPAGPIP